MNQDGSGQQSPAERAGHEGGIGCHGPQDGGNSWGLWAGDPGVQLQPCLENALQMPLLPGWMEAQLLAEHPLDLGDFRGVGAAHVGSVIVEGAQLLLDEAGAGALAQGAQVVLIIHHLPEIRIQRETGVGSAGGDEDSGLIEKAAPGGGLKVEVAGVARGVDPGQVALALLLVHHAALANDQVVPLAPGVGNGLEAAGREGVVGIQPVEEITIHIAKALVEGIGLALIRLGEADV